jgi:hypothetical protein
MAAVTEFSQEVNSRGFANDRFISDEYQDIVFTSTGYS